MRTPLTVYKVSEIPLALSHVRTASARAGISLLKQEEQRARKRALAVRAETSKLRDLVTAREADKVRDPAGRVERAGRERGWHSCMC